nr:hypothetical transcript [Hymenolepis microstoma]
MTRLRSSTLHQLLILHHLVPALLPPHPPHPPPLPPPPPPLAPPPLLLPTLASAHQGHTKTFVGLYKIDKFRIAEQAVAEEVAQHPSRHMYTSSTCFFLYRIHTHQSRRYQVLSRERSNPS